MLKTSINNFFAQFKKYLFSYKDGYFELPYLGNSPETLVASMAKMPFIKHNKTNKSLTVNNPFTKGLLLYEDIEKGLFVTLTNIKYKQNVTFKILYDENLSSDFYTISFVQSLNIIHKKDSIFNGFEYTNSSWSISKPRGLQRSYHEKDSEYHYLTYYASKKWVEANIKVDFLNSFAESNQQFVMFPDISNNAQDAYLAIHNIFENPDLDILALKKESYNFIHTFLAKLKHFYGTSAIEPIPEKELKKVLKAEKMLMDNILGDFPGIENISKAVGLNTSKLKAGFKNNFGQTMYQYFKSHQMNFAKQAIQSKNNSISEIAMMLGYSNFSKFSIAFKKHTDVLPSEYLSSLK